jgi:RNA polymerase sigma factor (sigma-70 family)
VAYSAVGNVALSEELAQATFVAAWRQLSGLQEPSKLRGWLCSIVRNLALSARRQHGRDPIHAAEPLEAAGSISSPQPSPLLLAILRDEEAIMWRALEQVPETYREPLVLFYRQHQSVKNVAVALDLNEAVVKMRLSRGRKLLQEQVLALVEASLSRTNPSAAFTFNVVSSLPAATTIVAAAKGGVVGVAGGKAAASAGMLATVFGPFLGLLGGAIGTKLALASTTSTRERRFARKAWAAMWAGAFVFAGVSYAVGKGNWSAHPHALVWVLAGSVFCYGTIQGLFALWVSRMQMRIRREDMKKSFHPLHGLPRFEYRSPWSLFGLPLLHVRFGWEEERKWIPVKGWIALGKIAYGVIFAAGGVAVAPVSFGVLAIGGFAAGALGIGLLAFGAMSLGLAATGGGAIGYVAYGGAAIGWLGAGGGAVVAHHFAQGGGAIAEHANDSAARAFMQDNLFFRYAEAFTGIMILLSWLTPAIPAFVVFRLKRRRRSIAGANPAASWP